MSIHSKGAARAPQWKLVAGAAAAALLLAVPVAAQPAKPPPPSAPAAGPADASAAFGDAIAHCANAIDDIELAEATLLDLGWESEGIVDHGPYQQTVDASKLGDALGDLYYYAAVEQYLSVYLVYCTFEIEGEITGVDLAVGAEAFGLEGDVQVDGDAQYGTWELFLDEEVFLVQAEAYSDYFFLQLNWVGDVPTGPVTGK